MPKSDTGSQRNKKRQITLENRELESRESKRRLSLSHVPYIRHGGGSQFSEIPRLGNLHICNATQQAQDVKDAESSAQILNNVIGGRKLKIT